MAYSVVGVGEQWWEHYPPEKRVLVPVTARMRKKEPTLVRIFFVIPYDNHPIKVYGPPLSREEKKKKSKAWKEKKERREAKLATWEDVDSGKQSVLEDFFSMKKRGRKSK